MGNRTPPSNTASGHRQRVRSRFWDAPEKMPEYEILELLLGYVLLRQDTKPLAKRLLSHFGSLRGILDARLEEVRLIEGIGLGIEVFLRLLHELLARHAEGPLRSRTSLCTPQEVAIMARTRLGNASLEEIWCAFVDNSNRLIAWEKMAQGTIEAASLSPRMLIERAVLLRASGLILVHNHPGGKANPSGADLEMTARLVSATKLVAIRFIDHVIVTENQCVSLIQDGLL